MKIPNIEALFINVYTLSNSINYRINKIVFCGLTSNFRGFHMRTSRTSGIYPSYDGDSSEAQERQTIDSINEKTIVPWWSILL